jgi:hypothetical protein
VDTKLVGYMCGAFALISGYFFGLISFQYVIYGLIVNVVVAEILYKFTYSE